MINRCIQRSIALCLLLLMSACGIDRGGFVEPIPDSSPSPTAQVGGTVSGTIGGLNTSSNTLIINGKTLDLSSTSILLNGMSETISALENGMFASSVSLNGAALETPSELRVDFNTAGGGVQFDPDNVMFDLFGQSVMLSGVQAGATGPDLPSAGLQSLGVSGFVTNDGVIDATSIVTYDTTQPFFVTGFAMQVDITNFTFEIGMQVFNYSQAITINTSDGMVNELDRLRVQLSPGNAGNALNVLSIDAAPLIDPRLNTGSEISLSGYITTPISNNSFGLSFSPMTIDTATVFENFSADDLTLDRLILIEGSLQSDGSVLVQTVSFLN